MSSSSYSYSRVDGSVSGVTSLESGSQGRLYSRKKNDLKHNQPNSTYIPHNRMSRYTTALVNLLPIRFKRIPGSEIPLDKIGLFSSVSFNWLNEYLSAGCKNGAKDKPLPTIAKLDSCQINGSRIDGLWHDHVVKRGQAGASVPRIAWQFVRTRVLVAAFIYLLGMIISLCSPVIVLRQIISATEERIKVYDVQSNTTFNNNTMSSNATVNPSSNETVMSNVTSISPINATNSSLGSTIGIGSKLPDILRHIIIVDEVIIFSNIGVLIVAEVVSYFLIAWSASLNLRTATRLRSACLALAYKKLIRSSIRYKASAHQTMTYFIPNSKTLYELISNGPLIFSGPLILLLCSLFIWYSLGHWALIGIVVLMTLYSCLVLTAYLAKIFGTRAMEYSLQRMSLMQEFIGNIFLAKVTLWDSYFVAKIQTVRQKELSEMRLGGLSEGWSLSMVHIIPVVTVSATTMACMLTNKHIISANYIPALVLILINLKHCIRNSWLAMSSISRGVTSLNKLKTVLTLKDADRFTDKPIDKNLAVTINRGHFTWEQDTDGLCKTVLIHGNEPTPHHVKKSNSQLCNESLVDINFYAPKEKLIGICGSTGSGKTSLLLSLMGHLHSISGHVTIDGSCSYVRQVPWLFDGTLKENILFGESLDATWYYKTIRACNLIEDIALLPGSDDTDLSQINLTATQKQKIVLARAVYTQRDINLLDNPLADVEPEEGKEIFEKSIIHALGTKTVIMISDRVQFLNRCDTIYVMRDGMIVEQGTHEELLQWKGEYTKLLEFYMKKHKTKYCRPGDQVHTSMTQLLTTPGPRGLSLSTSTAASSGSILDIVNPMSGQETQSIESPIKHSAYAGGLEIKNNFYIKNCGGWFLGITTFVISGCFSFPIAVSPLIFMYIAQKTITDKTQIVIILATVMGFVIFWGAILLGIYNKMVFTAARRLHEKWMQGLYRAQMSLFTTISSSMLLNICSLNLQEVDSVLPRLISTVLMHTGISIFSVLILGILSPWLLIPIAVFVTASVLYTVYARGLTLSLYETTQADSVVPMYNHAVNTIEGRAVIQTYHKEREFTKKFYKYCDNHSAFNFMLDAVKLWIEYRIKMLSAITLGVIILICASLSGVRDRFEILGLAFICTLQLALSIVHLTGAITSAYTSLLAISALDDYIENVPKEKIGRDDVPSNWPYENSIKFENVVVSENSELEPLNITIAPGEKVALTGTQTTLKTSFVTTLYRFVEISSGKVYIGNTNIADVQIDKLRNSISFIPGDPVLFDGTIRYNLDPTGKKTDEALMGALQKVFLWEKVSRLSKKMGSPASALFNVWEKKLLFLARALLKTPSKILIVEESVDNLGSEEDFFDKILRDVFADYTIIALSSHRVCYAQRTYCLDEGKVTEVSNRGSDLSQASIVASDILLTVPKNMIETNF